MPSTEISGSTIIHNADGTLSIVFWDKVNPGSSSQTHQTTTTTTTSKTTQTTIKKPAGSPGGETAVPASPPATTSGTTIPEPTEQVIIEEYYPPLPLRCTANGLYESGDANTEYRGGAWVNYPAIPTNIIPKSVIMDSTNTPRPFPYTALGTIADNIITCSKPYVSSRQCATVFDPIYNFKYVDGGYRPEALYTILVALEFPDALAPIIDHSISLSPANLSVYMELLWFNPTDSVFYSATSRSFYVSQGVLVDAAQYADYNFSPRMGAGYTTKLYLFETAGFPALNPVYTPSDRLNISSAWSATLKNLDGTAYTGTEDLYITHFATNMEHVYLLSDSSLVAI